MNDARKNGARSGACPSRRGANHALGQIEDLITRCATGDCTAFEAQNDASSGKLFAVSVCVMDTNATAENAMQHAYIKIWKNAGWYHVIGHSSMTWQITIARNTAIDHVRARRRHTAW